MQPENQSGAPVPQVPQAPQPLPQPVQPTQQSAPAMQPQSTTQPQQPQPSPPQYPPQAAPAQSLPPQQRPAAAPLPAPAPAPISPVQPFVAAAPQEPITQPSTPEALGSVAVAEQVEGDFSEYPEDPQEGEIDLSQPVTWQAKEYIHQDKGTIWFVVFGVVIALSIAVAWFVMHSWSFVLVLIAIAVVIVFFAKRPPRVMEYALSEEGLHIDNTLHRYADFRSFGVIRDGEEYSIMLVPRKRFLPGITVYFPEEAGEDIVDVLGSRMPMRDLHLDVIDRLVRKLRL